ncbi:sodium-translocating pyrophosphatase [Candidatus Bathyarchaeota archaeon]|nr:sodium-translocating pyrophosphatase [Candidatus Bathyarchaeota archaeon]MBL7079806.1 sodium-translocating pyrophosphatase [Candidatus Bathyarchaeota archaeon]
MVSFDPWLIAPVSSVISIGLGLFLFKHVSGKDAGTDRMKQIAGWIQEGSRSFLKTEYKYLGIFVAVMTVTLSALLGVRIGITYVFGTVLSALAGVIGMEIAVKANVRTANAARKGGLIEAFPIAFRGGAVMGLMVVGLALAGISIVYWITGDPDILLGMSIGASTLTLFMKAGGGIFTKSADIAADLVGKVELGIPEDDPRNPAVIADNVGDNVGDCAGSGADLFDSYIAAIMAAMILGASSQIPYLVTLPLVYAGLGILASIIGIALVRVGKEGDPGKSLNLGTYTTTLAFGVLTYAATWYLGYDIKIWYANIAGLLAGVVIGMTSDYFTSINRSPAIKTAEASQTGAAVSILTGFSYGLISCFPALLGIGIGSAIAFSFYGVYGIGIAAVGMLAIAGIIIAGDAYGPIGDNAKGIAEMAELGDDIVDITDEIDAAGNTTKAITKGFAIGAAGLTALALLASYQEIVMNLTGEPIVFNLMNPLVMMGIFIGMSIPVIFSAMIILGVSKNAYRMIEEIRRQFREIPGLMEGTGQPDYNACINIATVGALRELLPLIVFSILSTLVLGFVGGIHALGGYLSGAIFSGFFLAILMANAGGLWDNAKKYIESGYFGGKGSDAHKAAVIGDTVGDPFKDTAGPSLNTLVTVMSQIASLFAPLIITYALMG